MMQSMIFKILYLKSYVMSNLNSNFSGPQISHWSVVGWSVFGDWWTVGWLVGDLW